MRTIQKYEVEVGCSSVQMPQGAKIKHVAGQGVKICLWAIVDTDRLDELRHFTVYGTGSGLPDGCDTNPRFDSVEERSEYYVGTAHVDRLVWHVFERRA